jgi:hypothetical protein
MQDPAGPPQRRFHVAWADAEEARQMKKSCVRRLWAASGVMLALTPAAAWSQTYSVDLKTALNGLDVKITPVAQSGLLVMKLKNNTSGKIRCDLRYDAQPQPPARSSVFVKPGEEATDVLRETRKWFSVTVDVECKEADRKKGD